MTIQALLDQAESQFKSAGIESARREAEILFQEVLGFDRGRLFLDREQEAGPSQADAIRKAVEKRLRRIPMAYITGRQAFLESVFEVTPDVLIPRPETEELVMLALGEDLPPGARVLDLCCGSGCIGVSLGKERPDLLVTLVDISAAALNVARTNARKIAPQARFEFVESDLFESIPADARFFCIVSNPPYVHPDEVSLLSPEVLAEPVQALFTDDPARFLEKILEAAAQRLLPGGFVLVESSPRFVPGGLAFAHGIFSRAEVLRDASGKDRFLRAHKSA